MTDDDPSLFEVCLAAILAAFVVGLLIGARAGQSLERRYGACTCVEAK